MSEPKLKISSENLPKLAARVRVPAYNRAALEPSIVHIGVGGFNRAHQAAYLDELLHHIMSGTHTRPWAECGIGLLPGDKQLAEVLCTQDFLYTLVERSAHGRHARIIGSICDFIHAPANPEAAIEKLASPACRIVSMTITEGGYLVDTATGQLDAQHAEVQHDLASPTLPRTFLGYVTEALARRRARGLAPFTLMSCDNLQGNGHTTRSVVTAFAELKDPALRAWIEEHVAFPNSMVDRITPATSSAERALIEERFGIEDAWPVFTEPYMQWVLEDTFTNGRPQLELVGVQFTSDVTPFELMKVRLLNGSHFALAYPAAMLGFEFVHDVIADDAMRRFLQAFMDQVTPAVPMVAGIHLTDYKATLLERFANPNLRDQVERICSEGSSKLPKFILPSVEKLLDLRRPTVLLALVVACWLRYLQGMDEQGRQLTIRDAAAAQLQNMLREAEGPALSAATLMFVLGPKLAQRNGFAAQVQEAWKQLAAQGTAATLLAYVENPLPGSSRH